MKTKKLSGKLTLNKTTIQNLAMDSLDHIRAGWYKDSVYICSVPGSDCYCGTRPPNCTDRKPCWY